MIFIVDIGNSNTVVGIYKGENLIRRWRISTDRTLHAIGKSTLEGLTSGVFYGFVGMVDRVIEESLKEVDFKPKIIATGGLAGAIASASNYISEFDRDLTLKGLRIIAELNR